MNRILTPVFRQLVGIMAALEQFTVDADERGNQFIQRLLQKQSQRLGGLFNKLVVSFVMHFLPVSVPCLRQNRLQRPECLIQLLAPPSSTLRTIKSSRSNKRS